MPNPDVTYDVRFSDGTICYRNIPSLSDAIGMAQHMANGSRESMLISLHPAHIQAVHPNKN